MSKEGAGNIEVRIMPILMAPKKHSAFTLREMGSRQRV